MYFLVIDEHLKGVTGHYHEVKLRLPTN